MTLAFALAAAGIGALAAALLRQSLVLGYIVAGMAIGPNTPGFVIDLEACEGMDSTFMGFLAGLNARMRRRGGWVHIARPGPRNLRSLERILDKIES